MISHDQLLSVSRYQLLTLWMLVTSSSVCWALGSNVDSFTYTGNQAGLTTGTVYVLSTDNTNLGFCQLTPSNDTAIGYTSNCYTNYGTTNTSLYSAVAYMGNTSNPNNLFVVGDGSGKIYLTQLNFELSNNTYTVPSLTMTQSTQGCPAGSKVSNIALDPNEKYLYVGCLSSKDTWLIPTWGGDITETIPAYTLYVVPINVDGTLGQFREVAGLFGTAESANMPYTAGVWNGVSPVMRAYPANSPGLIDSVFSSTGAVMVSGLVGNVYPKGNDCSIKVGGIVESAPCMIPANNGVLCSNGICDVAYDIVRFNATNLVTSLFTAAELGLDYFNGEYKPALYWNEVDWLSANGIVWDKTKNTIYSCNLYKGAIGRSANACDNGSYALSWTPNGMPAAGNGMQVDISNLLFMQTPSNVTTPFVKGLLAIGSWSDGYLAYHSPATENTSTAMFMAGNGNNGKVGNINSMVTDGNGNLMYATSTSGLFTFNPFAGQNQANGSDITLIPNTVDSSAGGGGGWKKLATGLKIISYATKIIRNVAPLILSAKVTTANEVSSIEEVINPPTIILGRTLSSKSYRAQFLYTEKELKNMGVEVGVVLRGLSFKSAEGYSSNLESPVTIKGFQLKLSEPSSLAEKGLSLKFASNLGKKRKVVKKGPFSLEDGNLPANKVYPETTNDGGFGRVIWFNKPYSYSGGPLLLEITHQGHAKGKSTSPIHINGYKTDQPQGVYRELKYGSKVKSIYGVPEVEWIH